MKTRHTWARPTTWLERFREALARMCGATPPADICQEWLDKVSVNGEDRLQAWVLAQPGTPAWAQGIVTIEVAEMWADAPTEGIDHEARPAVPAPLIASVAEPSVTRAASVGKGRLSAKQRRVLKQIATENTPHDVDGELRVVPAYSGRLDKFFDTVGEQQRFFANLEQRGLLRIDRQHFLYITEAGRRIPGAAQ